MLCDSFYSMENIILKRRAYQRKWIAKKRSHRMGKKSNRYRICSESSNEDCGKTNKEADTFKFSNESINELNGDLSNESSKEPNGDFTNESDGEYNDVFNMEPNDQYEQKVWTWDMIDSHTIESSDTGSEIDIDSNVELQDNLSKWVSKFNIPQNAADDLLKTLRRSGHVGLPKTTRTLMQTIRKVETEIVSGMEYVYLGLKHELTNVLSKYPITAIEKLSVIELSLNIDGIPIFKSSRSSCWPVLCAIRNLKPVIVFPVVLTYGDSKPASLGFLSEIIEELNDILQNGIFVKENMYTVTVKSIICDAPAKAMVKAVKLYNGYYGCDKCCQKGVYLGRMTYQQIDDVQLRSDESFRNETNPQHHTSVSPFCDLPIDMVHCFPADYMHQVCLGVQKRCLLAWTKGKREVRLSYNQKQEISNRLLNLQQFIPKLFARKPRSLNELDRWKATEFRQFLLYTGKLVLKGILRKDLYDHFLVLNVAICILVSPKLTNQYSQYAHKLLQYYVEKSIELYGSEFLVYNVHSLIHLTNDAELHGCLDECSAFPFENYMQQIKKMVRSARNPVAQIVNRHQESVRNSDLPTTQYRNMSFKSPNNAYVLANNSVGEVIGVPENVKEQLYTCRVYCNVVPLFTTPCDSSFLGALSAQRQNSYIKYVSLKDLKNEAVMIQYPRKMVFLAVLHDF